MNFIECINLLEKYLYDYDIKSFSEQFIVLTNLIETIFIQSEGIKKQIIAIKISEMYESYQSHDYLHALEIAKYEIGENKV